MLDASPIVVFEFSFEVLKSPYPHNNWKFTIQDMDIYYVLLLKAIFFD